MSHCTGTEFIKDKAAENDKMRKASYVIAPSKEKKHVPWDTSAIQHYIHFICMFA